MKTRNTAAAAWAITLAAAVFSLAACKPADTTGAAGSTAAADGWDPQKSAVTEQRLETLAGIARELRDANSGYPVPEAQLVAEARKRHPGTGADDIMTDGYGRAIRYDTVHENTGHSLQTGFRFTSSGASLDNAADDLKREAIVEQTALIPSRAKARVRRIHRKAFTTPKEMPP